jgi:hypothetical protein
VSLVRSVCAAGVVALLACAPAMAQDAPPVPADPAGADATRGLPAPPGPAPARMRLSLEGLSGGKVDVGERFRVVGYITPYVPDQRVVVSLKRGERTLKKRTVAVNPIRDGEVGRFSLNSKRIIKPGHYRFRANKPATAAQEGAMGATRKASVDYPDLDPGDRGDEVKLFNKLLAKKAYYTSGGRTYGDATGRAVLAFRKVNNMARTQNATAGIYRTLAAGKGGFKLRWPEGGKHIETDLSRQVMVLARRGKPQHIFHISSGAPATPTVRGKFATYRKDYGTNSKGMIHSVYFHGGYATHGYHSVPTYPASHGCLRNPPANSLFIYNWIDFGDVFYIYG